MSKTFTKKSAAKPIGYQEFLSILMARTLKEKRLRPDLIDSVVQGHAVRISEIKVRSEVRFNNAVSKTGENLLKGGVE